MAAAPPFPWRGAHRCTLRGGYDAWFSIPNVQGERGGRGELVPGLGARAKMALETRNGAKETQREGGEECDAHHGENGGDGGSNHWGDARPDRGAPATVL